MEIIIVCPFLLLVIAAIATRFKLSKESPLRSILYSYGLLFLGSLCPASLILFEKPKDFLFFIVILLFAGLLLSGAELFFAWTIRPDLGKRYKEELNEILGRK